MGRTGQEVQKGPEPPETRGKTRKFSKVQGELPEVGDGQ